MNKKLTHYIFYGLIPLLLAGCEGIPNPFSNKSIDLNLAKPRSESDSAQLLSINLSRTEVPENLALAAEVAKIIPDSPQEDITYSLLLDPDNKFLVNGNSLRLKNNLDYQEKNMHLITLKAESAKGSVEQSFIIRLIEVNNPPVLAAIANQSLFDGNPITKINARDQNTNDDFDQDGDALNYQCKYDMIIDGSVSSPTECSDLPGVTWDQITGMMGWTPSGQIGTYEFKIIADDGRGLSDEVIFSITVNIPPADAPPVVSDFNGADALEDTEVILTLPYTDAEGDLATMCLVSQLKNIDITSACQCDGSGVCTVGLTGHSDFSGTASFNYRVVANDLVSNFAKVSYQILSTDDDAPTVSDFQAPNAFQEQETLIKLPYHDPDGDLATSCTIDSVLNISESTPCSCTHGLCQVGMTGDMGFTGNARFEYFVTSNGVDSNLATVDLSIGQAAFSALWRVTAGTTITLPLAFGYNYNFTVDWGDSTFGTVTSFDDPDRSHTYASDGWYTITITGQMEAWSFRQYPASKDFLYKIYQLGDVGWKNFDGAFFECTNLGSVAGGNTSEVTSMNQMFTGAPNAEPQTIGWDTSSVTDMSYMFAQTNLAEPDTRFWDTSQVTNMEYMFYLAQNADPDVSKWDTSKVTKMNYLFAGTLTANPNVRNWDTSQVETMAAMFSETQKANPNVSNWDVGKVKDFFGIFNSSASAAVDVTFWNTVSAENIGAAFRHCAYPPGKTEFWDTSKVILMNNTFQNCTGFNRPFTNWNFSLVTNMSQFLTNASISNTNYSNLLKRIDATTLQTGVTLHSPAQYSSDAQEARDNLISDGWTINDAGGLAP